MKDNKIGKPLRKTLLGIMFLTIFLIPTLIIWLFNKESYKEMFQEWIAMYDEENYL